MGLLYDDKIVKKLIKAVTKYCGRDLECIGVEKGDSYNTALQKINRAFCEFGYTFSTETSIEGCEKGLSIIDNKGEIVFEECYDSENTGCCDCSEIDADFEMVLEGNGIKALVTGGSGNYNYSWSVDMSPDPSESYPGFNPTSLPEQPDVFFSLGEDSFSDVAQTTDILVNVIATDTETNCKVSKSFLYTNEYELMSVTFSNHQGQAPCGSVMATATVSGGSGNYEYTWIYIPIVMSLSTIDSDEYLYRVEESGQGTNTYIITPKFKPIIVSGTKNGEPCGCGEECGEECESKHSPMAMRLMLVVRDIVTGLELTKFVDAYGAAC